MYPQFQRCLAAPTGGSPAASPTGEPHTDQARYEGQTPIQYIGNDLEFSARVEIIRVPLELRSKSRQVQCIKRSNERVKRE